jgi:hypothetical protein
MYHHDTMLRLANDRRDRFEQEAKDHRRAQEAREAAKAAAHTDQGERFSVRNLRWILLRPTGA